MSRMQSLVEQERQAGRPFALFSAHATDKTNRLALGLQRILSLPVPDSTRDRGDARQTTAQLRSAARSAFAAGAKGLIVWVAHEGASLFDRITTREPWLGLPGLEVWAADELVDEQVVDTVGQAVNPVGIAAPLPPRLRGLHFDESSMSALREWHRGAIEDIRARIAAGEFYQACLTFPIAIEALESLGDLFAWLMTTHPVDFGAWLYLPQLELASCSPELLFSLITKNGDRRVVSRPMKGTRKIPAGSSEAQIKRILAELRNAPKDRAENVMIADLLRNDLGRICVPGSISASALWQVERFASVAQMTSTIEGTLREGQDVWDVLAAVFPPGSMTGAPKISACAGLTTLERGPRGLYGGTLGWITPDGEARFSVIIRSLQQRGVTARWDVGGGIVSDSSPEQEWSEAWAKIAVLEPLWQQSPTTG